jgi:hypothetical protein
LLTILLLLAVAGTSVAVDLGNQRPAKPTVNDPQNIPSIDRQGGDTFADAVVVTLPTVDLAGTTAGYTDDYDEACPYTQSTSPDVVYAYTPTSDVVVEIDLAGSTYDTKLYVYDEDLTLVACNDDFYPDYVSKLEYVEMQGGVQYFIVIDGYGGDFGDYVFSLGFIQQCALDCPAGAALEGEPPLEDGYEDAYNGGCNSPEFGSPFGEIHAWEFCGVSGWYTSADGGQFRDTDWYVLTLPLTGSVRILGDAEKATYMFELGPLDCGSVGVLQSVTIGPCEPAELVITGTPGSTVWFWVGSTIFDGIGDYIYVLLFDWPCLPTEAHSWSGIKAIFD